MLAADSHGLRLLIDTPSLPDAFPEAPPAPGAGLVLVADIAAWAGSLHALAPDERTRLEAIRHPGAAAAFIVGRALARSALGRWLHCAAPDVPIGLGAHAKPALLLPSDLRFNLTHSDRHVAVALTVGAEIGLDIEPEAPPDRDAVAEVVMVAEEIAAFRLLPEAERDAAFLRLWTRKEAVLKAAGSGFSVDPTALTVGLAAPPPRVTLPGYDGWFSVADLPLETGAGRLPAALSLWGVAVGQVAVLRA